MGTIIREGYIRKSHKRRGYTRKDGTKVKAATVKKTIVPATRIKDRGIPGKGFKLIDMSDYRHLRDFGFSFSKNNKSRHRSLDKAVNKYGYAWTIRRLNALRTLLKNTEPNVSKKANSDIKYLRKRRKY